MVWETISLRMPKELVRKIEKVAKMYFETKSNFIRHVLAEKTLKELELAKLKGEMAKKFSEGEIDLEELKNVLGEEAVKAEKYKEITEKSFKKAEELAGK